MVMGTVESGIKQSIAIVDLQTNQVVATTARTRTALVVLAFSSDGTRL